jgi:hypothetical protein
MQFDVTLGNGLRVTAIDNDLVITAPSDKLLKMFVDDKDAVPAGGVTVITTEKLYVGLTGA